jgi:cell division septal protein FtsQ
MVQWLEFVPSKHEIRVRFPVDAYFKKKKRKKILFYFYLFFIFFFLILLVLGLWCSG